MFNLQFLGAAGSVTGSRYLLDFAGKRLLVDCGLFQGYKMLRLRNWDPFPVPPQSIDAVVLTHAHIDHSGYLPALARDGFSGTIFATEATRDLCRILLFDAAHLQEEDAKRANKYGYSKHHPAMPLYTAQDVEWVMKQFRVVEFGKSYEIFEQVEASWHRAGHILGAAMIKLTLDRQQIVFSGDLGRASDPILKPPAIIQQADHLILESTYGNRRHAITDPEMELAEIIRTTCQKGGSILIPSFAVGRAQLMLYYLYRLKQSHQIPNVPVYLDSPMAISVTDIFRRFHHEHDLSRAETEAVCNSAIYVNSADESREIDRQAFPKIILSASGMATGGRILHHLKIFAPDPKSALVFVGFQVPGTRGAKILGGIDEIKIHGEYYPIRASVHALDNLSAHADYVEILDWLRRFNQAPAHVFLTHGEMEASSSLKQKIELELGWYCDIPDYLDKVVL